ncbi:carboxypeptidase-like regulatory domain-containing protein [Aquiflexum sp. LQ15W]|uniref:carboxypeptidase-like regulatory domain-containing protein n=1 Tax=Cognataquiflexum nitidum TaxID=2922272 RepID=UPI001F146D14|nr:carboxypeptidase-like regulatory domain-containing protein [Cognataquiflexum nitidum]MCH6200180.1 carboxypeptidase-like regulatory domain-containing protein [Cognataquiflexum nitidum]
MPGIKTFYSLKFIYLFFTVFLLTILSTFGQYSLKGRVLDAETLEPLLFATVFISNSSIGTSTNKQGEFELTIPEGNHELVISYIGFQPFSYTISTQVLRNFYEFRILPETIELEGSEVKEKRDKTWYENLEVFKKYFLGSSANAKSCIILNPEVLILDGETNPNLLLARAKDILQIENPNLGYQIKYVLTGFEFDKVRNEVVYAGYPYFVEEKLPKRRVKKVTESREEAYLGSMMHFMRSLFEGNTDKSGYRIFATQKVPKPNNVINLNLNPDQEKPISPEKSTAAEDPNPDVTVADSIYIPFIDPMDAALLTKATPDGKVFITYNKPVYILYLNEEEESAFFPYSLRNINFTIKNIGSGEIRESGAKLPQLSKIEMRSKAVQVFENGSYFHPFDIFVQGYMGWERIGDLMPLDYGMVVK